MNKQTFHKCKCHDRAYTVCACGSQYCPDYWRACPRCAERADDARNLERERILASR